MTGERAARLAGRTALYRLFNTTGELLYVGVTNNLDVRYGAHATEKPWWHEVAERKVVWFESRDEALATETRAINDEKPRYNILGTPRHRELSGGRRDVDIMAVPWIADTISRLTAIEDPADRARAVGAALNAVPDLKKWIGRQRRQVVREMYDQGMSYAAIGKELGGISRARVHQIVGGKSSSRRAEHAERPTVSDRALDDGSSAG